MNKQLFIVMSLVTFFSCSFCRADDSDKEKFQLSIDQSSIFINGGTISNIDRYTNVKSKNASLGLLGVGLRYYPAKTIFAELDAQSVLGKQVGATMIFNDGAPNTDILLNSFTRITLLVDKSLQINSRINVTGGLGLTYFSSDEFSGEECWAEQYSACLKAGIDYTFSKRLQASIGISYLASPNLVYHQIWVGGGVPVPTFTIPIYPIMLETKLLFDL